MNIALAPTPCVIVDRHALSLVPLRRERLAPLALCTVLGLVLLSAGLSARAFLNGVESRYNGLLSETQAEEGCVREISMHAGVGLADIVQVPTVSDPRTREQLLQAITRERSQNDQVYKELASHPFGPELRGQVDGLLLKRGEFQRQVDLLIGVGVSQAGSRAEPAGWQPMLRSFVAYQQSSEQVAAALDTRWHSLNERLHKQVEWLKIIMLVFAFFPLLCAGVLLALALLLIPATPPELDLEEAW